MGEEPGFDIVAEDLGRMTGSGRNKALLLAFLVSMLGLSVYYNNRTTTTLQAGPSLFPQPAPPIRPISQTDELPSVAPLRRPAPEFSHIQRNVFEYGDSSGALPQDDPADAAPEPGVAGAPTDAAAASPGSDIVFLGVYREKDNPAGTRVAISDTGRIYVGGVGDTLGGRCKILKIEGDTLTLLLIPENITMRYRFGRGSAPEQVEAKEDSK